MTKSDPAAMDVSMPKPSFWRNLSFVWLVPVLALVISLGVAWQAYNDRGVLIKITFDNASGIVAGETSIRFRDVSVGKVEDIGFGDNLTKVLVFVRVDKKIAPYLDKDAMFWVVRPQVSARGISGLSTVLSGVYIEGAWGETPGTPKFEFVGTDGPPLAQPGLNGRRITLRTEDGKMVSEGAPVLFHGIEVGRLEKPRLTLSGNSIVVDAFIEAPHDRRITSATRFWDSSGFSISIGAGGLALDVDSLASLVTGGIEFDNVFEGGTPPSMGAVFEVYTDEAAARRTAFARSTANGIEVAVAFDESVAGLTSGAPVQLGGIRVGEVRSLNAVVQQNTEDAEVRLVATLLLEPQLLGLPAGSLKSDVLDFLEQAVEKGLRARLAAAGLFNSELMVELFTPENTVPGTFRRDAVPLPELPSAPSNVPDFAATAEGVLERINELPVERLLDQAIRMMASIENLAAADATRETPVAALALLKETNSLIADPGLRALPEELRAVVAELRATLTALNTGNAVGNLNTTLEQANTAAQNIATATGDVPALVQDIRNLVAKANSLDAEELIRSAEKLLVSADALIDSDAARAMPAALNQALAEMQATLEEMRKGGLVNNANLTMASARDAADAIATAAEGLPALSKKLEQLVAQSEALVLAYGSRSKFNAEALEVLREVKSAAKAAAQLARKIERTPNSLLFGK